ncbi:MAG: NADH-quinone oxidoreductase subunit J [Dehalococcoidales bacterium]|nr:NADH-quinone oxidoreductase subunit J [Dehalococcoidales bacterium]MDD4793772.1 NADH-quinone oxidoreductase subunit J [Dehalococcoidales bacterium]MDD5498485.1 NADH-quinone oxidoreductase subunit J [Dehalococcoidales bacterium]
MGMQIAFWILAVLAVVSAAGVIWQKNLFRAALLLVLCFLAVAGIFVTLSADFLAAVQLIINVGAVAILIIMSIMLTREVTSGNPSGKLGLPALAATGVLAFSIIITSVSSYWPLSSSSPLEPTTAALANLLFENDGFIFLIQLGAILLLTTIIGAIVLLRKED